MLCSRTSLPRYPICYTLIRQGSVIRFVPVLQVAIFVQQRHKATCCEGGRYGMKSEQSVYMLSRNMRVHKIIAVERYSIRAARRRTDTGKMILKIWGHVPSMKRSKV